MPCPYCGEVVADKGEVVGKVYKKHSLEDRKRVLKAAREETGWVEMAKTLGIPRNTAEEWVRQDTENPKARGAPRPKTLTEEIEETLISWLEIDCQLTQKQLKERIRERYEIVVSESTISRALHCKAFTVKKVHVEPDSMNKMKGLNCLSVSNNQNNKQ